ncbi:MAG: sugar ABC transporter permease [Bacillota bacterium]
MSHKTTGAQRRLALREMRWAYALLALPPVLIYLAVTAYPAIFSVALSMTDYNGGRLFGGTRPINFVGLRHYARMFQDQYFWISLKNNLWIVAISVFGQIPLGFVIAYALHRKLVRFRDFFQTVIYLPSVISTIVIAILWQAFFSPYGALTEIIRRFFNPGWVNMIFLNPRLALSAVLFVILWMYTGIYMIIFLANLQKIPPEILEAAKIDGASEAQVVRHVVLPMMSGVIVTSAIYAIAGSLKSFDLIFAMTAGNPARRTSVLAVYMYDTAFRGAPDFPMANAVSTFMIIVSLLLIGIVLLAARWFRSDYDAE